MWSTKNEENPKMRYDIQMMPDKRVSLTWRHSSCFSSQTEIFGRVSFRIFCLFWYPQLLSLPLIIPSSNSVLDRLPSVEDILESILASGHDMSEWQVDSNSAFRDVSLVVDNELLQRAAVLIDGRQIKKVVTLPGDKVFYEFSVYYFDPIFDRNPRIRIASAFVFHTTVNVLGISRTFRTTIRFY